MCTLSIISVAAQADVGPRGMRVVFSRDEDRRRPAALAPRWRSLGQGHRATRAIWPTDPLGGGTWIAAADSGLVLCLLNLNLEPPPVLPQTLLSRGRVIPMLLTADGAAAAIASLQNLDLDRFAPFRLVAAEASSDGVLVASWDRASLTLTRQANPACLVSSGLGDSSVQCRTRVFEDALAQGGPTPEVQDRFHLHAWPNHPELSVLMSRPDARTVSITKVELIPGKNSLFTVQMSHHPVREGSSGLEAMKTRPMALQGHGC